MIEPLIVIVDGDREHSLSVILADHIVIENLADFLRRQHVAMRFRQRRLGILADDVHAQFDAGVADENGRTGNELAHLTLALATEGAVKRRLGIATAELAHSWSPSSHQPGNTFAKPPTGQYLCVSRHRFRQTPLHPALRPPQAASAPQYSDVR